MRAYASLLMVLVVLGILPFPRAIAQNAPVIVSSDQSSSALLNVYLSEVRTASPLFQGKEFIEYDSRISGIPFLEENWVEGSVLYDSILYPNVSIQYDMVGDALLIAHQDLSEPVQVEREKVSWFFISGHHFVRLSRTQVNGSMTPGFYNLVTDGEIKLLIKRKRIYKEEIDGMKMTVMRWFEDQFRYYLFKDGVYYEIKNSHSFLALVGDHKKEIKEFLKKNKLRISREPEKALTKSIEFYNQLQ